MTFVIKSLAPIVAGGGLGTGGVYVYRSVIPTTWQEYLEREGFQILNTSEDNKEFKAIFVENEELIKASNTDNNLKQATSVNEYSKVKSYCEEELKKNTDYNANSKDKLIKLCTYSGISTVKAKIAEAKKEGSPELNWIKDDSDNDNKYKAVFAIYKYSSTFREWLNEGVDSGEEIKETDKPSNKFQKLKDKCKSESKKKHSENKENRNIYNRVYWWCVALPYEKVEDRIKKVDDKWEKETDGNKIKTRWEHTPDVKSTVKQDQSSTSDSPTDSEWQSWCSTQLEKKLHEDEIYRDKYLKIRFVCKKQDQDS